MKNLKIFGKDFVVFVISFFLFLNLSAFTATAQEKSPPVSTQPSARTENIGQVQDTPDSVERNSAVKPITTDGHPTMLLVLDVSLSVSGSIDKMRNVAKQTIELAPTNTVFGIAAVGLQASKQIFKDKAEALFYLDNFSVTSDYTDLGRGTDAALALLQEVGATKPTLIVYLTDGKVSLPKNYQDKSDFKEVLIREFSQRPDFSVLILNVTPKTMDVTGLPPNVRVVPLSNWSEAERDMKSTLAPQIQERLAPAVSPQTTTAPSPPVPDRSNSKAYVLAGAILSVIIAIGLAYWFLRRRRKVEEDNDGSLIEPENEPVGLMRVEDLEQMQRTDAPTMTALLEFQGAATSANGRRIIYETLLAGEKRIIGNATAADLTLACLRQASCLEFRFDGEKLMVFRLRPQTGEFDDVLLNDAEAPVKFVFRTGDSLRVNDLEVRVSLVDEEVARLMTEKYMVEADVLSPFVPGDSIIPNRRFRGRRQIN